MDLITSNILSLLIFIPILGALALAVVRRAQVASVALVISGIVFLLSLIPVFNFDPVAGFQFIESYEWISFNAGLFEGSPRIMLIRYRVGLDGISLWLVPLTTLLTLLSIWFSTDHVHERERYYYAFMLLLEGAIIGVFVALDLFLFFIFWELVLIPMYFLIGIWGGGNRIYATIKFVLYTMAGSAFMLAAIIALGIFGAGQPGQQPIQYGFAELQSVALGLPPRTQMLLFLAFAVAFAIKVPLFPFHTWLPDAHVQAPTAGSVILAGVLLKMGTYGYLRLGLTLFPAPAVQLAPIFAALAIIGILYGAWVAYAQRDIKSLVAYSSVSHLGFVMLGIFALNVQGLSGGVLQMVNHGLSTGALFLLVGMIYERRHTRDREDFGGLWSVMPVYASLFLITMLASVGLPGLNGFVGEFLALLGAFAANPWWAVFATFGVVLAAGYMLRLFGSMFFGPLDNPENAALTDLTRKEVLVLLPLVLLMILIGVAPDLFLAPMQPTLEALASNIDRVAEAGLIR